MKNFLDVNYESLHAASVIDCVQFDRVVVKSSQEELKKTLKSQDSDRLGHLLDSR